MRRHYIDHLRWPVILLLVPYHAAMAFNSWGEPNYIFFYANRTISCPVVFFSPFLMPLMFLFAGMSTRFSLQRRSVSQYLAERVRRLLIPLAFCTLAIMPVMAYLADRFQGAYTGSFLQHYGIFFTKFTDLTGADGGFSFGQFWFLLYLFVISAAGVCVITMLAKMRSKVQSKGHAVLRSPNLAAVILLGLPLPFLHEVLSVGGKSFAEYFYVFLVGYYVFSDDRITERIARYRNVFLVTGLCAGAANVCLFLWPGELFGGMEGNTPGVSYALLNLLVHSVAEWFMILALIGIGKRYLEFDGKMTAYFRERSMLFFALHFLPVILMQYCLAGAFYDNPVLMYFVPVILSYVLTFVLCEIAARIPPLAFLLGAKIGRS